MLPLNLPINSTSLGASAFHILENIDRDYSLFPIGGGVDLSSFEPLSNELKDKINKAVVNGLESHNVDSVSFRLWHHFVSQNT